MRAQYKAFREARETAAREESARRATELRFEYVQRGKMTREERAQNFERKKLRDLKMLAGGMY